MRTTARTKILTKTSPALRKRHARSVYRSCGNLRRVRLSLQSKCFARSCPRLVRLPFSSAIFVTELINGTFCIAFVSRYTLSQTVPHLIKLFYNPDELPNRGPVLSLLSSLISAARDSTVKSSSTPDEPGEVPLSSFKDEVLGALTVGLKAPSSAQPAIEGLLAMVTTPALLEDEEIGFIVQNVNDVLVSDRGDVSDIRYFLFSQFPRSWDAG